MTTRRGFYLALVSVALLAGGCGTGTASPAPVTAAPTSTVAGATSGPSSTATADATATPTPPAASTATPTPTRPPATPAGPARGAWARHQTVVSYALVAPGVGWVHTNLGIWETDNDGATWANVTPRRLIVSKIRGLGALDGRHALMAVADVGPTTSTYYMWRTSDGGATWAYTALPAVPHDPTCRGCDFSQPGDPAAYIDFVDTSHAFAWFGVRTGIDGLYNHEFATTDGGAHWTALTYEPPDPALGPAGPDRIQFQSATTGVGEFESVISSTTTGWGGWTHRDTGEDSWLPDVDFVDSTHWYANLGLKTDSSTTYYYLLSTDQGHTWHEQSVAIPHLSETSADLTFISPTTWIATFGVATGSSTYGIPWTYLTTNAGGTWTRAGAQPFAGSRPTWIDRTHGWTGPNHYVSTGGISTRIFSTDDGGASWRLITP